MFCPKCGKSDQTPNSYCRSCGEFLNDQNKLATFNFGGNTPQQNVNVINFLSIFAALFSLFAAFWMYISKFDLPVALFFGAAVLLCNAVWHFSNFIIGTKLKKRLNNARKELTEKNKTIQPVNDTQELLPEADTSPFISPSVTENTTKHLDKIPRK